MRTVVLAALGLMIATPPVPAQDQPTTWAGKLFKDDKGNIPTGHDFGTMAKGAVLHYRFPIKNIYAVPLAVSCDPSCSCVTVTPATQIIQANDTATIDVSMDTMRFNTPQKNVTVSVTVRHYDRNPQFWSSYSLQIKGVRRDDVELAPREAVAGIVSQAQQGASRELMIRYHGSQPDWQITGLAASQSAPFEVTFQQTNRRRGQVDYRVVLTLRPDAPAGSLKGEVNLVTNDQNNLIAVPYDVTVQAPLSVSPAAVNLPVIKVGTAETRRVNVRAGQPFRI